MRAYPEPEPCCWSRRRATSGLSIWLPESLHMTRRIGYIAPSTLAMSNCVPADAGQDYGIIEHSNGKKIRVMADRGGWRCVENKDYRFRLAQETARLSS